MNLFEARYSDFTIKWATLEWEKNQALALRRQVFCTEQGLFEQHDLDALDADPHTRCLVAIANHGGWPDKVVGTVRIHPAEPMVWWGSRLAVDTGTRGRSGIGAALIRLAVGSARGLGCQRFLAQVQKQNEVLFQRLNWNSQYELPVRNRPHVMMEAELSRYPIVHQPESGFVVKGSVASVPQDMAPCLLHTLAATDSQRQAHV
ncbi:MAG: MSMEG_0567/Sll0786 family nitrogen starvation N-acetyltransferase [Pseudomonadota bacterium]|nr:MSMEG_0567/Sll0786 family nitrogen starvation N-acetyltransferase [Pseudomonadota bacterium]